MFITRRIYVALTNHLKQRPMTVITGMRRTGKTTLLRQLLTEIPSKNKLYFDLERIDHRELFSQKNYDAIIHLLQQRNLTIKEKIYLAIDEIQLLPNIVSVLKYLYDNYEIKFIVTGSSSYYFKNLFTESLAGRKRLFTLYPLDFGEFLTFKEIPFRSENFLEKTFNPLEYERLKPYYEEYLNFGGFPEVALLNQNGAKKDLLADIISSYINIDIKTLSDFTDERELYQLMKMLAVRTTARLDYSKLSRLTGIHRLKVQNYLDLFENTYLVNRISVLTKNPDREIVKAQKLYFCDNGILKTLAEVDSGVQFENAVFNQLKQKTQELRYFSLKTGREIDLILDNKIGLEIKETPISSDAQNLKKLACLADLKKTRLIGRFPSAHFTDYIWGGDIK